MPGRNKTGPQGQGPLTGRGMGNCSSNESSPNENFAGTGRGFLSGFGRGRGFGNQGGGMRRRFLGQGWNANVSDDASMKNEIDSLKNEISQLENKIEELQKKD